MSTETHNPSNDRTSTPGKRAGDVRRAPVASRRRGLLLVGALAAAGLGVGYNAISDNGSGPAPSTAEASKEQGTIDRLLAEKGAKAFAAVRIALSPDINVRTTPEMLNLNAGNVEAGGKSNIKENALKDGPVTVDYPLEFKIPHGDTYYGFVLPGTHEDGAEAVSADDATVWVNETQLRAVQKRQGLRTYIQEVILPPLVPNTADGRAYDHVSVGFEEAHGGAYVVNIGEGQDASTHIVANAVAANPKR